MTIPPGGIYAALANGAADASEGDPTQIRSLNLHEVQFHLSLSLAHANTCFMADIPRSDEIESRRPWREPRRGRAVDREPVRHAVDRDYVVRGALLLSSSLEISS